ncbi:MAG: filamentous hemagglutinin N-terminal domain-containing protein, partial [Synechococcales bacterium]|nr:filamentous hemagglutinin N-terminal domain-containing protein [Synechococcales bacterium]
MKAGYFGSLLVFGAAFGMTQVGLAQSVPSNIVPDDTLGEERSTLTPAVIKGLPSDQINGGAVRGSNLFHSFQQFNIGEGHGAYFANPVGIENILSRVTGTGRSEILGKLGVLGDANLFLLNPNGIVFGPKSSLDVVGSFTATTADAIQLGDRGFFSASQPQQSGLLAVAPGALLYEQIAAQGSRLVNTGNLIAGQDLTLAANNLELQGQLRSGRDLTLQAQDTVRIRDSVTAPFMANAGRNLTIQGDRGLDILTLSNVQSRIQSGSDLTLISNGSISGDTHFFSGGNLSMVTLTGTPGNFVSLYDPIIYVNGDVSFGNYSGASLKIEATGSIQGGNIEILTPDGGIPNTAPDFAILTGGKAVIL